MIYNVSTFDDQFAGLETLTLSPSIEIMERIINEDTRCLFENLKFDTTTVCTNNEQWIPILETFSDFELRVGIENIQAYSCSKPNNVTVKHIYQWILAGQPLGNC